MGSSPSSRLQTSERNPASTTARASPAWIRGEIRRLGGEGIELHGLLSRSAACTGCLSTIDDTAFNAILTWRVPFGSSSGNWPALPCTGPHGRIRVGLWRRVASVRHRENACSSTPSCTWTAGSRAAGSAPWRCAAPTRYLYSPIVRSGWKWPLEPLRNRIERRPCAPAGLKESATGGCTHSLPVVWRSIPQPPI